MRTVIYTFDFEPITIIELPIEVLRYDIYRIAIRPTFNVRAFIPNDTSKAIEHFEYIKVHVEKLHHGDKIYPLFFIANDGFALALRTELSKPIVGDKLKDIYKHFRNEFIHGLTAALRS